MKEIIQTECEAQGFQEKDVLKLVIKYLGLSNVVTLPPKGGQLTKFETRQFVCDFWYKYSEDSTNTTDITSIRPNDKSRVQSGLSFASTVTEVIKRNRSYYQGIWKTVVKTYRELFQQYLKEHPGNEVLYGTFIALKPFYVHHASTKDLVMCCCILHLHVRWSIIALIRCLEKQNSVFPCSDYLTFFSFLYTDCEADDSTYVSWECVLDRNTVSEHISVYWEQLKGIALRSDNMVTVPFTEFQKQLVYNQIVLNKKWEPVKR